MRSAGLALLVLFTIGWIGFSALGFYVTTTNSDCSYTPDELCTHLARAKQQMIIWRWLAVQLVAIFAALAIWKR